ncbi:hypothetical protein [Ligilactobacillus cholophilus]|uniref:hypothetical protein n=1 Tax=Ligilactobacillus cholophilus TaxID=3050131 RepID=UPI0025B09160|nr:hypothetical protein [Ligilactobacillus cholophilus]
MVNHIQLKTSITIGTIIMAFQLLLSLIPSTGLHKTFTPIFDLFHTAIWYVPILYFLLRLFVICGSIYLIFRVINYILNFKNR